MRKIQKGFTLIELMIVVAIIGILAAIAIPAYQDYVIRSQVSEGLTLASSVKTSVAEYFADRGDWPTDIGDLGITDAPSGKYVTGITVNNGTIDIEYGHLAKQVGITHFRRAPAFNGEPLFQVTAIGVAGARVIEVVGILPGKGFREGL